MRMKLLSFTVFLLLTAAAIPLSRSASPTETCSSTNSNSNTCMAAKTQPECGLYMAPSTLGEDANLGMYAGRDILTNYTWYEMAVPLLFREWGDHRPGYRDGVLWDRYIWEGDIMNIETYEDTNREKSKAVFVPGIGCTVNSLMDMHNIQSTHESVYDTVQLHRSKDPGVTAFTPYHSAKTRAVRDIAAGTELMAMYGDFWIPDIPNVQVTLKDELELAELFLQHKYLPFITKHNPSTALQHGLWELMKSLPYQRNSRAMSNLPRTEWKQVSEYYQQLQKNSDEAKATKNQPDNDNANDEDKSIVKHFIRQSTKRSMEWLQQNGYCQDHMEPKPSTIPQAGRGAFATRPLPQGTIVGYSPLVHIGTQGQEVLWLGDRYDLVINYSFQHANSTVILTPYGGMVNYINHAFDKSRVNVKVQWLRREFVAHKPHWLYQTAEFLHDTIDKIGLSFEYVALRDIEEGEEILMDYGPAWEQAWEYYAAQYTPIMEAYVSRAEWNETRYRTPNEDPYPSNLATMCFESYSAVVDEEEDDGYIWVPILRPEDPHRVYCTVLERIPVNDDDGEETAFLYTVQLHLDDNDEPVVVHRVPEDGIFLYDRAFSQDWHLPGGFRHPIGLPDDVLPPSWVNVVPE